MKYVNFSNRLINGTLAGNGLKPPELVNQLINLISDEKRENIYILHMTDERPNADD